MEGVARGLLLSEAGSKRKVLRRVVRRVEESCLRPLKECSGLDGSELDDIVRRSSADGCLARGMGYFGIPSV